MRGTWICRVVINDSQVDERLFTRKGEASEYILTTVAQARQRGDTVHYCIDTEKGGETYFWSGMPGLSKDPLIRPKKNDEWYRQEVAGMSPDEQF